MFSNIFLWLVEWRQPSQPSSVIYRSLRAASFLLHPAARPVADTRRRWELHGLVTFFLIISILVKVLNTVNFIPPQRQLFLWRINLSFRPFAFVSHSWDVHCPSPLRVWSRSGQPAREKRCDYLSKSCRIPHFTIPYFMPWEWMACDWNNSRAQRLKLGSQEWIYIPASS